MVQGTRGLERFSMLPSTALPASPRPSSMLLTSPLLSVAISAPSLRGPGVEKLPGRREGREEEERESAPSSCFSEQGLTLPLSAACFPPPRPSLLHLPLTPPALPHFSSLPPPPHPKFLARPKGPGVGSWDLSREWQSQPRSPPPKERGRGTLGLEKHRRREAGGKIITANM